MKVHLCLVIACVLALLTGCGGGSSSNNVVQPPAVTTTTSSTPSGPLELQAGSAPIRATVQGIGITLNANALSQASTVVVSTTTSPPPIANEMFTPHGTFLEIERGSATITGGMTFDFPDAGPNDQIQVSVDGVYVPLHDLRPIANGGQEGTLDFEPGDGKRTFEIGLVKVVPVGKPPHENWGSWNGFVFDPVTGKFVKIVSQGTAIAPLPSLGAHPLLFVHGLGSQASTFNDTAAYLARQGVATRIVAFEYDTLDSVEHNGTFLREALTLLASGEPAMPTWNIVAHSMGTLVTRSAVERPGAPPVLVGTDNRAVLMCGPQLGTPLIATLQERNLLADLLTLLNENGYMTFTNRDGRLCVVTGREAGINDLRVDSLYLATLNQNPANNHPQMIYFTMAGNTRRTMLNLAASFLRIFLDDGVVNVSSAGWDGIGQRDGAVQKFDHLTVNIPSGAAGGDGNTSFPQIATFLTVK